MGDKKDKASDSALDVLTKYKHLANPLFSLSNSGTWDKLAPTGKWSLSKNPAVNLALWNSLGVASWAVPVAALTTYLANKWHDKKLYDRSVKATINKLTAAKPYVNVERELEELRQELDAREESRSLLGGLIKGASGEGKASDYDSNDSSALGNWVSGVAASTLPILTLVGGGLGAKYLVDKLYERNMKRRLLNERKDMQDMQNAIDLEILRTQGLLKASSDNTNTETKISADTAREVLKNRRAKADSERGALGMIASWPIVGGVLGTSFLGLLALHYLNKADNDRKLLKDVRDKALGINAMQTPPELSLGALGVPVEDAISRPGDAKQPTYLVAEEDTKALPAPVEVVDAEVVAPIEGLEELKSEDEEKKKKADALF